MTLGHTTTWSDWRLVNLLNHWDTRSFVIDSTCLKFGPKQQTKVAVKKSPGSSLPKKPGPRFAGLCTTSCANLKDLFVLVSSSLCNP